MAEDRSNINVSKDGGTLTTKLSAEERKKKLDGLKSRFIQILDRGLYNDRIAVKLPPDKHGEWVPNDAQAIRQYQELGFEIDTEYSKQHGLMNQGDDAAQFGDTVFMVCERELKDFYTSVERQRYRDAYEKDRSGRYRDQREFEKEFEKDGNKEYIIPEVRSSEDVVKVPAVKG